MKIDGLESDLDSALDVLWRRGDDKAREWVRLNHPDFAAKRDTRVLRKGSIFYDEHGRPERQAVEDLHQSPISLNPGGRNVVHGRIEKTVPSDKPTPREGTVWLNVWCRGGGAPKTMIFDDYVSAAHHSGLLSGFGAEIIREAMPIHWKEDE